MRSPRRSRLSCFDADPLLSDGASPPSALSLSLDEDGDVFVALPVLASGGRREHELFSRFRPSFSTVQSLAADSSFVLRSAGSPSVKLWATSQEERSQWVDALLRVGWAAYAANGPTTTPTTPRTPREVSNVSSPREPTLRAHKSELDDLKARLFNTKCRAFALEEELHALAASAGSSAAEWSEAAREEARQATLLLSERTRELEDRDRLLLQARGAIQALRRDRAAEDEESAAERERRAGLEVTLAATTRDRDASSAEAAMLRQQLAMVTQEGDAAAAASRRSASELLRLHDAQAEAVRVSTQRDVIAETLRAQNAQLIAERRAQSAVGHERTDALESEVVQLSEALQVSREARDGAVARAAALEPELARAKRSATQRAAWRAAFASCSTAAGALLRAIDDQGEGESVGAALAEGAGDGAGDGGAAAATADAARIGERLRARLDDARRRVALLRSRFDETCTRERDICERAVARLEQTQRQNERRLRDLVDAVERAAEGRGKAVAAARAEASERSVAQQVQAAVENQVESWTVALEDLERRRAEKAEEAADLRDQLVEAKRALRGMRETQPRLDASMASLAAVDAQRISAETELRELRRIAIARERDVNAAREEVAQLHVRLGEGGGAVFGGSRARDRPQPPPAAEITGTVRTLATLHNDVEILLSATCDVANRAEVAQQKLTCGGPRRGGRRLAADESTSQAGEELQQQSQGRDPALVSVLGAQSEISARLHELALHLRRAVNSVYDQRRVQPPRPPAYSGYADEERARLSSLERIGGDLARTAGRLQAWGNE